MLTAVTLVPPLIVKPVGAHPVHLLAEYGTVIEVKVTLRAAGVRRTPE